MLIIFIERKYDSGPVWDEFRPSSGDTPKRYPHSPVPANVCGPGGTTESIREAHFRGTGSGKKDGMWDPADADFRRAFLLELRGSESEDVQSEVGTMGGTAFCS